MSKDDIIVKGMRKAILKEIKEHPEKHKHYDMSELRVCSTIEGAIDMSIMLAHEGLLGHNGGVGCDVRNGPCSCGAWHHRS